MIRVASLTSPPIEGVTYLVPCVESQGRSLPLLGPVHADPDHGINAPYQHGHLDPRFLADDYLRGSALEVALRGLDLASAEALVIAASIAIMPMDELLPFLSGNLIYKGCGAVTQVPLVCTRSVSPRGRPAPWKAELEAAYAGRTLEPGGLCPHRRAHVLSQRVGVDGLRVCPMHGLGFDSEGRQCPVLRR